jgi:BirA family biotin operon repressor/biotin-[acetyl-CoA-carboxylase] ligase
LDKGFYPIKLLWEGYAISIGKNIKARTLTNVIEGKALGITDDGVLKLEDATGIVHHIYSADIEI